MVHSASRALVRQQGGGDEALDGLVPGAKKRARVLRACSMAAGITGSRCS